MEGTQKKSQGRVQSVIIETGQHGRKWKEQQKANVELWQKVDARGNTWKTGMLTRKHRVTSRGEQRETGSTGNNRAQTKPTNGWCFQGKADPGWE